MLIYCSAESHRKAKQQGLFGKASLVICPQILVGHWAFEISKFVDSDVLVPLAYEGSPSQRQTQQTKFSTVDVVIMSYETLRSDSAAILQHSWRYCILDEGHVIRNSKAKISQVIPQFHTQEEEATPMCDKYSGFDMGICSVCQCASHSYHDNGRGREFRWCSYNLSEQAV